MEADSIQSKVVSRVGIPDAIMKDAVDVLRQLKGRRAQIKIEDLFQELFGQIGPDYWKRQLDRFTPDDYLLELAKENPEARLFLIAQARKVLDLVSRGEPVIRERKRPGPKPKAAAL